MADQRMIGEILSERRAQLRLSIDRVASDTKLQPRVIQAFESSDFDAMPPKGYAQATLASYARYLDLDPDDVLPIYEAQLRRHQREADAAARSSARAAGPSRASSSERRGGTSGSRSGSSHGRYSYSYASSAPGGPEAGEEVDGAFRDDRPASRRSQSLGTSRRSSSRTSGLYDDPTSYHRDRSREGDDYARSTYGAYGSAAGRGSSRSGARDYDGSPFSDSARGGRAGAPAGRQTEVVTLDDGYEGGSGGSRAVHRGTSVHGGHPTSEVEPRASVMENLMGVAQGISAYFRENRQLALIVAGVAAALVLVLIIFGVTSCASRPSGDDGTIPVTPLGGSSTSDGNTTSGGDTAGTTTDAATQGTTTTDADTTQASVPLNTGPNLTMLPSNSVVNFFVSLDAATNPWIEVNVDGAIVYAEQAKPGATSSFVITRTATVTVSNPELVSLSVNGTPVQTTSSNGTNVLTLSVDPAQQPPADAQPADQTADPNAAADATGDDGTGQADAGDAGTDGDAAQQSGTYAGMDGLEILHDEWGDAYYLDQNGDPNYYYDDGTPVG